MYIEIEKGIIKVVGSKPREVDFKQDYSNELFETIKVENGKVYNLEYHQRRVDNAYENYFKSEAIKLNNFFKNIPSKGLYRAKLIYNKNGFVSLKFYPYREKKINKILLIESRIDYKFKYLNRDFFNYLHSNINADEFIITQNGYLKDFTIGNIALLQDNIWHTPKEPLLFGTTLKRYLNNQQSSINSLQLKSIHYKDLKNYSKIALLNAMVDFNIL